jgi:zinc protease
MGPESSSQSQDLLSRELCYGAIVARFANGLKVIVQEDHRTPVAICQAWVRAGSNWEIEGLRGWAHGIEHMLFKGTARRAEGDFAREVAAAGGTTNAGTGYESTSYHILVPADNLDRAVDILADALFHASFTPEALDAERKVLVHENHMYDDIPYGFGITWRWGMELAFQHSPYRHPIGGRDEELLATPHEEIVRFWRRAYRPDNMTVVVVGDVDADETLDILARSFGAVNGSAEAPLPEPPLEPVQTAPRCRLEQGDLQKAYAKLIFHAPGERAPERPVLSVIQRLLSDGRSSRLYQVVQEERQLVSDISLLNETGPREGIVLVDIESTPGQLREALQAAAGVLADLATVPVEATELAKAKLRVERSFQFGTETVQGQSANLGHFDLMGDLEGAFSYPARVAAVTADEVRNLAERIFRQDNLSVQLYVPNTTDPSALGLPTTGPDLELLLGEMLPDGPPPEAAGVARPTAAVAAPATGATPARPVQDAPFQETRLASGLPVYLRVDRARPTVAMGLYARGGSCLERSEEAGLATLTQHVQAKGTDREEAAVLHAAIEALGGSLSSRADRDHSALSLTALVAKLPPLLERLGDLACRPSFPAAELERERRLALEQLQAMADDTFQCAGRELRALIYGDHPYGRPVLGTEKTLVRLGRDQLVNHHQHTWVPENLLLVVSGDMDPDRLLPSLEDALAGLPSGSAPRRLDLAPISPPDGVLRRRLRREMHQSVLFAAWPGPPDPETDRPALLLLQELMNGQSGRLFEALRNRRSLCYNTGLLSTSGFAQGMLAAYVLTEPETVDDARAVLLEQLQGLADARIGAAEFERARAKLVGNLLISIQANVARMARCAIDVLYGRGPNHTDTLLEQVRACTADQVREAAGRYLDPAGHFEVELGPES